jgi:Xaa-Pro aminopeptidase
MAKRKRRVPSPVIADRLTRCRQQMKKRRTRAFLVSSPLDYFYLTGFTGEDSAVLITPRAVHLITDSRFDESSSKECPWARRWMRKGMLNDEIVKVCRELGIKSLAVQPDHMSLADHAALGKMNKSTRLVNAPRDDGADKVASRGRRGVPGHAEVGSRRTDGARTRRPAGV